MRERLVKILQKHDPPKARRVDEILRKFKGRESFLLEKVVEKYEGCVSQNWDTNSAALSCVMVHPYGDLSLRLSGTKSG